MSTQEFTPKKPQIGKWILIVAIAIPSLVLLLRLLEVPLPDFFDIPRLELKVIILYLPLSFAAAILYLIREEQAAAARVWGILGGFVLVPFGWWAFPAFFMAIGGGALAPTKPKLAGGLMLAGVIMSVAGLMFLGQIWTMNGPTGLPALLMIMPYPLAISFLIPGGILALTSRKGKSASKKMAIVAIAALFVLPLWYVLLDLSFFLSLFEF